MRTPGAIVDERTDLYAVAMIMLASLSGRCCSLRDEVREEQLDAADPPLADVLLHALHTQPAMRYPTADAFAAALKDVAMRGRKGTWDVYLSYRAPTEWYPGTMEAELARKLHDQLARRTLAKSSGAAIRVRLDRLANRPGTTFRDTIAGDLARTAIFVPIVSRGALVRWAGAAPPSSLAVAAAASSPAAASATESSIDAASPHEPLPSEPRPPPELPPPPPQRTAAQMHSTELSFDLRLDPRATGGSATALQRFDALLLEWQAALALHECGGGSKYANACRKVLPLFLGSPIFAQPSEAAATSMPAAMDASAERGASTSGARQRIVGFRGWRGDTGELMWDERGKAVKGLRGLTAARMREQRVGYGHASGTADAETARDDETGHFCEQLLGEHRTVFADLFQTADADDAKLVDAASRISPATVVRRLLDIQGKFSDVLVPSKAVSALPGAGAALSGEAAAGGNHMSMAHDALDELASAFADIVEKEVDHQCSKNVGFGSFASPDTLTPLEPLTGRLTFESLFGPTLIQFGLQRTTCATAEALMQPQRSASSSPGSLPRSPVVLIVFGRGGHEGTRLLEETVNRALLTCTTERATGALSSGSTNGVTPPLCHVVYVSLDNSKQEFDQFTAHNSTWWAVPFRARTRYGERARKLLKADSLPTVVVTHWAAAAAIDPHGALSGVHGSAGFVEVLNDNATHEILGDPRGLRFPWTQQGVGELMGDVLLRRDGSNVHRESALLDVDVLAIYFGGEWCPHCVAFKPTAQRAYAQLQPRRFEMVYVSHDRDREAFDRYFEQMDWLAVPYERQDSRLSLRTRFKIDSIPTVLVFQRDPLNRQSFTLMHKGRDGLSLLSAVTPSTLAGYPWQLILPPTQSSLLRELPGSVALVVLCEHLAPSSFECQRLHHTIEQLAHAWQTRSNLSVHGAREQGRQWPTLKFMLVPGPPTVESRRLRSAARLPEASLGPETLQLLIVDQRWSRPEDCARYLVRAICEHEGIPFHLEGLMIGGGKRITAVLELFFATIQPGTDVPTQAPVSGGHSVYHNQPIRERWHLA